MSIFGSPSTSPVGPADARQGVARRDRAKRPPAEGGRSIADTVEVLVDSPEGLEPAGGSKNDGKQRPGAREHQPPPRGQGAAPARAPLDVQG